MPIFLTIRDAHQLLVGSLDTFARSHHESHDVGTWQLLGTIYHRAFGCLLFGLRSFGTSGGLLFANFPCPVLDWRTWLPAMEKALEMLTAATARYRGSGLSARWDPLEDCHAFFSRPLTAARGSRVHG